MEDHDDVSGVGFSPIPRSDLKIGSEKPKSHEFDERQESSSIQNVNSTPNSGNVDHASNDIDKANELSQVCQEAKLDLKTDVHCGKRDYAECVVAKRRSRFDLNEEAVSSCLNDGLSSSVCSSGRGDKPSSSMDVYSECGSSNVPIEEKDPMKLWKAMKQNGFITNPHCGGISATSSSCFVSSSHGGIPAPRKRDGCKTKKTNNDAATVKKRKKIEIAKKEEVDRFVKLAAPSGLLNELNPGIINHVRNKKQVLSIIQNIVKSENDIRNYSMRYYEEKYADGESIEENNTVVSRFQMSDKFSENASSLTSEEASELNCNSVLTVKAATVASQWLELLHQDIKGRVSALRRSKKRVRAVVTTELPFLLTKELQSDQENAPNLLLDEASRPSTIDIHKTKWMSLFKQLEQTLSEEEEQLENWLNQVRELQSHCDQGLQHLSLSSRGVDSLISNKDLVVRASAASIYSICHFIASKENITCT